MRCPMIAIVGSRKRLRAGLKFWRANWRANLGDRRIRHRLRASARDRSGPPHRASIGGRPRSRCWRGGHDKIYPPEHEDLLAALLETRPQRFPKWRSATCHEPMIFSPAQSADLGCRASLAWVVVEAAHRSGSLIHGPDGRRTVPRGLCVCRARPSIPARGRRHALIQAGRKRSSPKPPDVITHRGASQSWRGRSCWKSPTTTYSESRSRCGRTRAAIVCAALTQPGQPRRSDPHGETTSPAIVRTVLLELELAGRLERHRRRDGLSGLKRG